MARLPPPMTMITSSMPDSIASSTPYWMVGLSTRGSISLGCALVAGRKRVPSPAAGNTALRTFASIPDQYDVYYFSMPDPRVAMAEELFQNAYRLQMEGDFDLAAQFYIRSIE